MKTAILLSTLLLVLSVSARATSISFPFNGGFQNDGNIPDDNLSGWSDTQTLPSISFSDITDVTVALYLSDGYNGDLYAYLSHDGGHVVLLNRVGVGSSDAFGYSNSGMAIVLNTTGTDIHTYGGGGAPIGMYSADGRIISPLSSAAAFGTATRLSLNGIFAGMNPNGDWTLFLADVVGGGGESQLTAWGLTIDGVAVPDSAVYGLDAFLVFVALVGIDACRRRTR